MFQQIIFGFLFTLLAILQILSWIAIGSFFFRFLIIDNRFLRIGFSILIGSAITATLYSIFSVMRLVTLGIFICMFLSAIALIYYLFINFGKLKAAVRKCKILLKDNFKISILTLGVLTFYWIIAIMPPRDADVMRYHLAHIRQIIIDGGWEPIFDYCYAFPFGWSINYLPYEFLGIPQVAHLLNLGLFIITCMILYRLAIRYTLKNVAILSCLFFVSLPLMLKTATTAHVDMYIIFVVACITLVVVLMLKMNKNVYILLGFGAWIGIQSRYQAFIIGIAVTLYMMILLFRKQIKIETMIPYSIGSVCAIILSSPFYIFNFVNLRNPVWPFMIPLFNGLNTYANQVAAKCSSNIVGSFNLKIIILNIKNLLMCLPTFPIPILLACLIIASIIWKNIRMMKLIHFIILFSLIAFFVQPNLDPRTIFIIVIPIIVACILVINKLIYYELIKKIIVCLFIIFILSCIVIDVRYSQDYFQYLINGNKEVFHQNTWFYDVYKYINESTPENAKFLVIVTSGHSYYLNRSYRRADPWLSGEVDWLATENINDFKQVLQEGNYRYIVYEDRNWDTYLGGKQMSFIIKDAIKCGILEIKSIFDVKLTTRRIFNQYILSEVLVLKLL